jgi:GNAT superfamily N-acetyltransferase
MSSLSARSAIRYTSHEGLPAKEAGVVDDGLGQANMSAAPLHEVKAISCFARLAEEVSSAVLGGAVGRIWGQCCELQQLWVDEAHRRQGIGAGLVTEFEKLAVSHACTMVYLETFSFQAPELYRALGYVEGHVLQGFPGGIKKYLMVKHLFGAAKHGTEAAIPSGMSSTTDARSATNTHREQS